MKKFILILMPFLLTGCFGANNDFVKKCTYVESSMGFNNTTIINVNYNNKDVVTSVIVENTMFSTDDEGDKTLSAAMESAKDNAAVYKKTKGIEISETKENRKYKLTYNINVKRANEKTLKKFNIKNNAVKYIKYLEDDGYTCTNAS